MNAAVWFGGAVFFTIAAGPAFFSTEMLNLVGRIYAGAAAQILLERYFNLQLLCAALALIHLLAEWLYTGKLLSRWTPYLLLGLLSIGLVGGFWLQPKLKALHLEKYGVRSQPAQRLEATRAFSLWHGVSQTINLLALGGLTAYLWQITQNLEAVPRWPRGKFRS